MKIPFSNGPVIGLVALENFESWMEHLRAQTFGDDLCPPGDPFLQLWLPNELSVEIHPVEEDV